MTQDHTSHPRWSFFWRGICALSLAVYLLGCVISAASTSAANRRAVEVWKKHEIAVELAIKGEQRNDEFEEACLFFEQVTGISIHVNIFTLGFVPEEEAADDLERIRAWYRENHERLFWDEVTGTVKVRRSPPGKPEQQRNKER